MATLSPAIGTSRSVLQRHMGSGTPNGNGWFDYKEITFPVNAGEGVFSGYADGKGSSA
jgi:hypothetical protein